jgi:hypothetical protein
VLLKLLWGWQFIVSVAMFFMVFPAALWGLGLYGNGT